MGTIADRLNAVKQVKTDIKTAIEDKGLNMEGVPFTEYADKVAMIGATVIKPLEVTENGTYTAEEGEAFNPVTVDIKNRMKMYLEAGGKFKYSEVVDYRPILEYDDTENLTTCWSLFDSASSAEYIPQLNTKNCNNFGYMFAALTKIKEIPLIDTTKGKNFSGIVRNCYELPVVPALDVRNGNQFTVMFENCRSITEIWIKNIGSNIQVSSGSTYGHLLTVESLIHLIYQLRDTGSSKTFTIGNVNLDKLANVYVRLVEITDEMRAEDDLIDEKLPFEVCESTDEGAIQIVEYAKLKNWNIA
jgi:hypothetical protein